MELPDGPRPRSPWLRVGDRGEAALAALESTRDSGHTAGLVVLATGLGKTWLAAFDSARARARRVLFVAHREEILRQALATFRRIQPTAKLGLFTGDDKQPDADVLFASVQTLGRARHLATFPPDAFDYIVIDEFHHAAARTYRRLIDHFRPSFLLGLTATPERTDGGDLLALCGENLVYRCDLVEGIRQDLLSPFHYVGVPDEVDYAQIPWRSTRFDEEALEAALATRTRADNALDQYRRRAGRRTLAFCASKRHADFMARHFQQAGVAAMAVHSGQASAPRATSLERLAVGELDVVFAVDMFNEGVDLPTVDTVLMLRPTESRVVWLQQFGRGLRRAADKDRLTVIDYIGNHRVFLLKPQALLGLPAGDASIQRALDLLAADQWDLPPGCEISYELEAVDIIQGLLRLSGIDVLQQWYDDFRTRHGQRPTALEALHEHHNPRSARRAGARYLVSRSPQLDDEFAEGRNDPAALRRLLETNPIAAWTGGRGTGGEQFFAYRDGSLATTFDVPEPLVEPFGEHARELAEWRLADYPLRRADEQRSEGFVCTVSHSGDRAILFLPPRAQHPEIPSGWMRVQADGEEYEANVVKVAVNVLRRPGDGGNVLTDVLRGWFGPAAGQPGTTHRVAFEQRNDGSWVMHPR